MENSRLVISEKNKDQSVLIVDKMGLIGEGLAERLCNEMQVVYVSQSLGEIAFSQNVVHIPYKQKFPSIPENRYSYMFIVDDGAKVTRDLLPKFMKKSLSDNAEFLFLVNYKDVNNKQIEKIIKTLIGAKIIIYGDIFKKGKTLGSLCGHLNRFIYEAKKFGKINIEGDGLGTTLPVLLDDAVVGSLDAIFGKHTSSLFYLFPKHAPTQISLAHIIQRIEPSIKIDFVKKKSIKETVLPTGGEYLLDNDYNLQDKVKNVFLADDSVFGFEGNNEVFSGKKNKHKFFLFFILWTFFIVFLPLISTLSFAFLGAKTLTTAKKQIEKGDLLETKKQIKYSQNYFSLSLQSSKLLMAEAIFIGQSQIFKPLLENIKAGTDLSKGASYLVNSLIGFRNVFTKKSLDAKSDFVEAGADFKNAITAFQKVKAEYGAIPEVKSVFKEYVFLDKLSLIPTDILPGIFGFDKEKHYLVLFQNNMELRPTGGFIGSYGILDIDRGAVKNFSIHDVYDADGQLKGHVEPPYPIRRYLPLEHWYLRDSNFDVDFLKSASMSAFFLDTETGSKVDGVLAIDVSFVKSMLSEIGQIYLTDYKLNVNSDNLFELTEGKAENEFFPGSKQKKNFLKSLFGAILLNLSSRNNAPYASLARVIAKGISEKHLLVAFSEKSTQNFFTVNGWSGSLWDERRESENAINDFIGINEANLGGNKVNYFIKRKVKANVSIDNNGKVIGEIIISYDNKTGNKWPGGDYKNYIRVILQKNAELLAIFLDGKEQEIFNAENDPQIYESKKFINPIGIEVEKTSSDLKSIFGFMVNIPAGETKQIKVKYLLPEKKLFRNEDFYYSLKYLKQPGTDEYLFGFSLSFPPSYKIINPQAEVEKKSPFKISKNINSDYDFLLRFVRD